jgi:ubiquinone/menaquinone biosynthesis C-methylase UbiE
MMTRIVDTFNRYAADYDRWFDANPEIFASQSALLHTIIPEEGTGLEVGVGSGRFASSLGIRHGIDPSPDLLTMARNRGVETVLGAGEFLPYRPAVFDYLLMMTVICFIEDIDRSFHEAFRVIRSRGTLIIGFLEKGGEVALPEQARHQGGRFLQHAVFRSVDAVMTALRTAGFSRCTLVENLHGFCIIIAQKE